MTEREAVVEVLARYVRAMEARDGATVAALFAESGSFAIFATGADGAYVPRGPSVVGRAEIAIFLDRGALEPSRGIRYLTTDHIVDVDVAAGTARLEAQFLGVETDSAGLGQAVASVASRLLMGTAVVTMLGLYQSRLTKVDGRWLLLEHHVKHSLPFK
jgi:hypothetical protein